VIARRKASSLTWLGYVGLFLPLVVGSCGRSSSDRRRIERAQQLMTNGDRAMVSARWVEAKSLYDQSRQLLTTFEARDKASPLDTVVERIEFQLGCRLSVFGSPEAAVLSSFRLAADPENEDLLAILWDMEGTVEKALGRERWTQLSAPARRTLISYVEREVKTTLGRNHSLCTSVQVSFPDSEIKGDKANLSGEWTLGSARGRLNAELRRDGPVWRMVDISSDIMGSSFSGLVAKGVESLARLRPLEEALLQENGEQLLVEALEMSFNEEVASSDRTHRPVLVPVDVPFKVVGGGTKSLARGTMVELLDERRTLDGRTEVKVRPVGATWNSQVGWIPEAALPSVEEGTVWGTEEIPLPG